jgi:MoaA/NifB/PqqE/SkfB family radical SAM enzyme
MDFGLIRKIADEAAGYGPRSFSLHLFGEPLLYPRIFDAIRYIKGRRKGNTVLLTTNGTVLNDCINDFVSAGIDQAYWTWRREARFTESTVLKLRKWGKFRVRFIDGITPDSAREEWKTWKNVEGRRMHNYGGEIKTSRFKLGKVDFMEDQTSLIRWPCYHLWLAPAVAWNGKILMCCADPHQKEVFGDALTETVSKAWQRIERVRQSHLRGEYSGICEKCDVWREYPDIFFSWQKVSGTQNLKKTN